ncbi:hypothetical protein ACFVTP_35730 [Streptomyces celluloflavus]|uniref:hypothetical protein n=1 Tax=Streptomyces celluloflavus TaxID=58344 RepID=UPI0036DC62E8
MKLESLGRFDISLPNAQIPSPNLVGPRLAMVGEGSIGPTGRPLMRSIESGGGEGRATQKVIPPYCKPLDGMGRATGVETRITQDMLDTGTKASRRM